MIRTVDYYFGLRLTLLERHTIGINLQSHFQLHNPNNAKINVYVFAILRHNTCMSIICNKNMRDY